MHNNTKYKFVNGPLNAVRLEGEIYGIKKVLYVFMDVHLNVQQQTHCSDFDSIEFVYYVIKMLKASNKNKIIDLFTETTASHLSYPDIPFRGRYIDEINKYLKHEYKKKNSSLNNVRAHYIDVRDYVKNIVNELIGNLYYLIKRNPYGAPMNKSEFDEIRKIIFDLNTIIKIIKNLMLCVTSNEKTNFDITKLTEIIKKISTKYNHHETIASFIEIKKKIDDEFQIILQMTHDMYKLLDEYETIVTKNSHALFLYTQKFNKSYRYGINDQKYSEFLYKLNSIFDEFDNICIYTFASIVDIYFLRRFIDKDYITNGIIYTGASHSVYYIYHLVKYYNFKITHISDAKNKPLSELHTKIKNSSYDRELEGLFFPKTLIQCINVQDFPSGFE